MERSIVGFSAGGLELRCGAVAGIEQPECSSGSSSSVWCLSRRGVPNLAQSSVPRERLRLPRRSLACCGSAPWLESSMSRGKKTFECGNFGRLGSEKRIRSGENKVPRRRAAGYAYSALAAAFPSITKTEKTLALPIDYYQILGAETHFGEGAILRAFEARLAHPPKEGYSQDALGSRIEILRGARDTLADSEWRGEYNQGLIDDEASTLVVDVPWSKISGALCLLQEVGEMEVVLEAGQGLLNERLPKSMRRDVVLSMALAYVELSREAMAEAVPTIVRSCDLLEKALKLLQEEGGRSLAADLQEQIEQALEELTPRCVLQLLATPLDKEHESQRAEGLQGLKSILWAVGEGGVAANIQGFTREQLIKDAFAFLTASEQVAFWNATPDYVPAESFEVYAVALAHVAEGFTSKKPVFIVKADELLWQLQSSLESEGRAQLPLEHSLERAMCWLLMGEVDKSMNSLGLLEGSEDSRDPAVVDFVYSHSEGSEEGDLLPGLCKLLENWLGEVVFPTFRDTEDLQVRLGDYYDDPAVVGILEDWEITKGGSSALARIGAALDSIKTSAVQTFQKVFPLRNGDSSTQPADRDFERLGYISNEAGFVPAASLSSTKPGYSWRDRDLGAGSVFPLLQQASKKLLTPAGIALTGIIFGAFVMIGLRFLPFGRGPAHRGRGTTTTSGVVQEQQAKMDARLAEHVVRRWQSAKARALGPMHLVTHLPEVLEGKMLDSWTDRVNEVSRNGWHWEYRLVGLNIDSVTVSDDGRKAIVEATLQEAARLFDSENPEHKDSYRSTYTTRYELLRRENDWRITGGVVLRS